MPNATLYIKISLVDVSVVKNIDFRYVSYWNGSNTNFPQYRYTDTIDTLSHLSDSELVVIKIEYFGAG